jgi:hypothetical protein
MLGKIYVNPGIPGHEVRAAEETIAMLRLDDAECERRRREDFDLYVRGEITASHLRRSNPFVWSEARRQSLL